MKMNVPLSDLTGAARRGRRRERTCVLLAARDGGTDERETRGLECMTYNPVRNEVGRCSRGLA